MHREKSLDVRSSESHAQEDHETTIHITWTGRSAVPALDHIKLVPIAYTEETEREGSSQSGLSEKEFDDPMMSLLSHAREYHQESSSDAREFAHCQTLSAAEAEISTKWSNEHILRVLHSQRLYSGKGVYQRKQESGPDLDPVFVGLVSEKRATELFEE